MAERYLFFNSTAADRRMHQASDLADYWQSFLGSGLIHEDGQPQLGVSANNNRQVKLSVGRAIIQGHLYINDSDLILNIENADTYLNRIDRVVLRYDNKIENRFIKAFVLKGTASETPVAPELTRNNDIYEISLAQINVVAGKSFIEQSDIVDERLDKNVCGLASSLVSVPTDIYNERFSGYMQQIANEWQTWFNHVENASYITGDTFAKRNRDVGRQLANLNAIADINDRAIGNTGQFYDLFDNTNDYSVAKMDNTGTYSIEVKVQGSYLIKVIDTSNLKVGQEINIYYTTIADVSTLRTLQTKITAINGNILTIESNNEMNSGAFITRTASNNVEIQSWLNPTKTNTTINSFANHYSIGSSQNSKAFITGHPVGESYICFINDDGTITKNSTMIYASKISLSGEYLFYKTSEASKDMIIAKIDYMNKTFTTFLTIIANTPDTNQKWTPKSFEHIKVGEYDYFLTYKDYTNYNVAKYLNGTLVKEINLTLANTYGASMYYSKKRGKIIVGLYPNNSKIYELNVDTLTIEKTVNITVKNSQSGFSLSLYHQQSVSNDNREYSIYTPKVGDSTNKVFQLIYFNEATQSYTVKELLNDTLGGSSDYLNISVSKDGFYYMTMEKIYLVDGSFNSSLILDLKPLRQSSSLQHFAGIVGGANEIIGAPPSPSYVYYRLKGVTSFKITENILRYNFKQPIKNLAGWLIANKQLDGVQASLSLVDSNSSEDYKPLAITQNGNEYEFLETSNLYSKDKATLKITITGNPDVKKLLGAVE